MYKSVYYESMFFYRDHKLVAMLHSNSSMNLESAATVPSNDNNEEEAFEANLINSTVYIIAMSLQVSTFAINYRVSGSMRILSCVINISHGTVDV